MPFGPYKMSGYGQELGEEALKHYSKTKMVYMEMNDIKDGDTFF
jgi:acyl-CoA reductase-like NAD-dependent aldehyde dehydrogenase